MRLVLFSLVLSSGVFFPVPVQAQHLGDGDYEQCRVYDRDGNSAGFSNECLERKRARIRHYDDVHPESLADLQARYAAMPYNCPYWANMGNGYNATFSTYGAPAQYFGTFDSTLNGRPCLPNPVYIQRGVN